MFIHGIESACSQVFVVLRFRFTGRERVADVVRGTVRGDLEWSRYCRRVCCEEEARIRCSRRMNIMRLLLDCVFLFMVSCVCTQDYRVQEALEFYFHASSSLPYGLSQNGSLICYAQ